MDNSLPLLRWAGSKKRQYSRLRDFFPDDYKAYVEPFAGSASFFFRMAPKSAKLNDLNSDVVEFYRHASRDPTKFFSDFDELVRSKRNYYVVRDRFNALPSCREKSILFYFLNRNCFNGIYRTNKSGEFNVPFSSDRVSPYLTREQFNASARLVGRAKIYNEDFESFCQSHVQCGDFVYLDPPYYKEGQRIFNEYNSVPFSPDDFDRLMDVLLRINRIGSQFLLTFPLTAASRGLAREWNSRWHRVLRTVAGDASKRVVQTEMLIYNYEI